MSLIQYILPLTFLLLAFPAAGTPFEAAGERLTLHFAAPEAGMGLTEVTDRRTGEALFRAPGERPLLWRIEFTRAGDDRVAAVADNRQSAGGIFRQLDADAWSLTWPDLPVGEGPDRLSVELRLEELPDGSFSLDLYPEPAGTEYTFNCLIFPILEGAVEAGRGKVLFPRGNVGSRLVDYPLRGLYPSCESQVQFFGLFRDGAGLYLGLHDPVASRKFFELDENLNLQVCTYGADTSLPGKSRFPAYPVMLAAASDPWEACRRYRDWALQQVWAGKGPLAERGDLPPGAGEIGLWLNLDGPPGPIRDAFLAEAGRQNAPTAVHWYNWSIHHFDRDYPDFFPAQEAFAAAVRAMRDAGGFVVPYINGRLWDTALPDYRETALPGTAKNFDGSPRIEDYGSGTTLAAMCPASPIHRGRIASAVAKLVDEYGVNGIYVDQVGAAAPVLCYDPSHGHPLGGGGWWQEATREQYAPITEHYGSRVLFATENGSECYLDSFSCFLLWMAVYADDFPSLPLVYGQHAWYFCSPAEPQDDLPAFTALLSRCLLWNIGPGWLRWLHGTETETADRAFKRAYVDRVIRLRRAGGGVMRTGSFFGALEILSQVQPVAVDFHRNGDFCREPTPGITTSPYGTCFLAADGLTAAGALAEVAGTAVEVRFRFPPELLAQLPQGLKVCRWTPEGEIELGPADREVVCRLEPYDLQLFLLR